MATMKTLDFFKSVNLPEDDKTHETFKQVEDILQQEHDVSGRHPLASDAQAGFMTPIQAQQLQQIYKWFLDNVINVSS